ncbi:hypothetical protein FSP39_004995 [Pinctada imbricata]|uniref:Chloride channel CLIC-like protein 1 n=1 Tax=Pinctada imbricata TaxID=66713 RepID=A0AA88XN43_PINIB|nr:hypothetical protein FSP39_004995 [Pinctada imbricata]
MFLISLPWEYVRLYQMEVAKRMATIQQGAPAECIPQSMGMYQSLKYWLQWHFSWQTDPCEQFHRALMVDPLWEVPPMMVLSTALSRCITIPVCDRDIILDKHQARLKNHPFSEVSKAPKEKRPDTPLIDIGDLVYLHCDRNKSRARDRYLVVASEAEWCSIRKFVGKQLRNCSYRVKKSECFRVPSDSNDLYLPTDVVDECSSDDNEEAPAPHTHSYLPPSPAPDIPIEISASGTSDINLPSSVESDDSKPQTMIEPNIDVSMPTEQHTSDRPRRNIRLPSRFNDFVM